MASSSTDRFFDSSERIPLPLLPQHGGPASPASNTFTALLQAHPFLFRVYTPHARQNLRSPSPAHSRYGSRASSRTRPQSRAASPPPSRSVSTVHHPNSTPSRPLSRRSSYFSGLHSTTTDETDVDEPFFLSPRSKELRDAASDVVSPDWHRSRQRTISTVSRLSGMSGMSGFSDVSSAAGALSDSWTSVGGESAADEDMMIDATDEDKEAENTVSQLGLTRSLSSALIVPQSPSKMHHRAASFESRRHLASMSSSMTLSESQLPDEKPTLSTLLAHLDPGTRSHSSYVSASMSFFYALWEAVRRYRINIKHDVEIAIIDGKDFIDEDEEKNAVQRVWTVDEMMYMKDSNSSVNLDDPTVAKPLAHLVASQTTLIQGAIASSAVYSSLQLRDVIPALPGYFFKHEDGRHTFDSKTFENLIWDAFAPSTPNKKRKSQTSFRQFCATASRAFLSDERSHGDRVRDSTTGAVNLAGALVGRWAKARVKEVLHQSLPLGGDDDDPFSDPPDPEVTRRKQIDQVREEIKLVVAHLTVLIAAWPSRSWFDAHLPEIDGLIDDVVEIYVTGLIEAAQTDASNGGGDERRGREEMRDGQRVHSPIPTRRAFSINRGLHYPDVPVTPPRTPPPHTTPSSMSRAGSERALARMRSPLVLGERDSPSSVGKGIGRSLSLGGVLDSGRHQEEEEVSLSGDGVSGSASAADGLLPSPAIIAPRPHPPSRPLTPAQSSVNLNSRPSTPLTGGSVHFATPSPAPSPARHHSEIIKRPKSPVPPVPPRRASTRPTSAHSTPALKSTASNLGPTPFPTSAMDSPPPERSSSVASSRVSLPHSKSQPEGILRKATKEGSEDGGSTKDSKGSRLTWPRTLKRVGSVPNGWGENASLDSSSEKGGAGGSLKNAEGSPSKRNSLFGKPRQRTITLTRATTGPKKDREISKEMEEGLKKDEPVERAEKRKRKMSLGHIDLGLHLGDLFKRGSKKGKEKQKGSTIMAGAIAAGSLATHATGMASKPSSKALSSDSYAGASLTAREGSTGKSSSSSSLSKPQELSREPSVHSLKEPLIVTTHDPIPDEVDHETSTPHDAFEAEDEDEDLDRHTELSPVQENEREGDGGDEMHSSLPPFAAFHVAAENIPLPDDDPAEYIPLPEDDADDFVEFAKLPEASPSPDETRDKTADVPSSPPSIVENGPQPGAMDVEDSKPASQDAAVPSFIDVVQSEPDNPAFVDESGSVRGLDAPSEGVQYLLDDEFESRRMLDALVVDAEEQQPDLNPGIEEVPRTPQLISSIVPDDVEDAILEPSIIDSDIEWTDHEYGKSLEPIDESVEEVAHEEDLTDALPSPVVAFLDESIIQSHSASFEVPELIAEELAAQSGPSDTLEDSRALPGAFLLGESPMPETNKEAQESDIEDRLAPSFINISFDVEEQAVGSEHDNSGLSADSAQVENPTDAEVSVESTLHKENLIENSTDVSTVETTPAYEESPELQLVEMLRSSPQFKEAEESAAANARSVDFCGSDDGMSETVFSAANSGHPSDDEDLSVSWRWRKKPARGTLSDAKSRSVDEIQLHRRARSLSTGEQDRGHHHERIPTFLSSAEEESQRRKNEEVPSLVRSSSWAVSCFVCGVLVTLFVMSTQRRDLLTGHRLT